MVDNQATKAVKPPLDPRGRRSRTWLHWGLTVLAATVGIVLIAAVGPILRGQQKPQAGTTTSVARQSRETFRAQAEQTLKAGDATTALSIARTAVGADPTNAAASDLVTRLSAGSSPPSAPTGSPGTAAATTTPAPSSASRDAGYIRAVTHVAALLPSKFLDYTFEPAVITPGSASVSASLQQSGSESGRFIWTVRDRKTVRGAQAFVSKTTKVLYNKHRASPTVHGVTAYYGTDGQRIATVTYTRGRYVFEVLLSSDIGPAMSATVGAAFRDTPVQ